VIEQLVTAWPRYFPGVAVASAAVLAAIIGVFLNWVGNELPKSSQD